MEKLGGTVRERVTWNGDVLMLAGTCTVAVTEAAGGDTTTAEGVGGDISSVGRTGASEQAASTSKVPQI